MTNEESAMALIANAGDGRSYAFRALQKAKKNDFEGADELIKKAEEALSKAHKVQTSLLVEQANGKELDMNILLVHSLDHLMTGELALELIKEIIELRKERR